MRISLKDLNIGERARILGFKPGNNAFVQKLLAMGLIPQTEFQIVRIAPLGDPIELQTTYSTICVRREEASEVLHLEKVIVL